LAGYSDTPLLQKLGIKEGTRMATVNAPATFRDSLGELPLGLEWSNRVRSPLDLVVGFYSSRAALTKSWPTIVAALTESGAVWIAWPKRMSGVETDLTDAVVREELLGGKWVDNKVCAIDETFTALRFCIRVEQRRKRTPTAAKPARLVRNKPGAHR
jgi:hypothetical protein